MFGFHSQQLRRDTLIDLDKAGAAIFVQKSVPLLNTVKQMIVAHCQHSGRAESEVGKAVGALLVRPLARHCLPHAVVEIAAKSAQIHVENAGGVVSTPRLVGPHSGIIHAGP